MIIPAILGTIAVLLGITLVLSDKNERISSFFIGFISKIGVKQDTSARRLFSTAKGFLLILCLVVIFATLVFYFG